MVAAYNGYVAVAEMLLDGGAAMDVQDNDGWTALYRAALNGHLDVVKLLLSRGSDRNIADRNGKKPVDVACQYGNAERKGEISQLLLAP